MLPFEHGDRGTFEGSARRIHRSARGLSRRQGWFAGRRDQLLVLHRSGAASQPGGPHRLGSLHGASWTIPNLRHRVYHATRGRSACCPAASVRPPSVRNYSRAGTSWRTTRGGGPSGAFRSGSPRPPESSSDSPFQLRCDGRSCFRPAASARRSLPRASTASRSRPDRVWWSLKSTGPCRRIERMAGNAESWCATRGCLNGGRNPKRAGSVPARRAKCPRYELLGVG